MAVTGSNLQVLSHGERSLSFFAIFAAGFAVVLTLAIAGAVLHLNWRSLLPGAENRGSLLGSVTTAVYSFMSYLP
jgi:hypothetical protein